MFRIFEEMEMYDSAFEIYIEDKLVNKQRMQAPKEILIMNFVQLYNQLKADKRPIRIKMIVPMTIWDNFENKQKVLDNYVEFKNNAMIAWEENKEV